MTNDANLKRGNPDTEIRSGREAAEMGRKGGIASGHARRRKRAMKDCLCEALAMEVTNPKIKSLIKMMNVEGDTNYDALTASIIAGALKGDPVYAKMILELIGETAQEKRAARKDRREERALRLHEKEVAMKEALHSGNDEVSDDGFMDAIKGTAAEDWGDDESDI